MGSSDRETAYAIKMQELIDKVGNLEENEVKRALALLEALRKEVASTVADSEWKVYFLPRMKEAVNGAVAKMQLQYRKLMETGSVNLWNAGIDQVDWPLNYVGIRITAPEIARSTLEILQGFSADLITNLTEDAAAKINAEITMGLLGGKSPWDVMQTVGRNLTDPGVFRNIAVRAETITRTEMARVNSMARQARQEAVVEANSKERWLKKWISSGKFHPRPHHAALNGTTVAFDKDFPGGIPYPHAPGLPAAESINCG
jgi:hypothetical protein